MPIDVRLKVAGSDVETLIDEGADLQRLAAVARASVPTSLVAGLNPQSGLTLDKPAATRFIFETEHLLQQHPELDSPFVRRVVQLLNTVRTTPGTSVTFYRD